MAAPERCKSIELRSSARGLSAWVDGKFLGMASVEDDRLTIFASMRQAIPDVVMPEYLLTGNRD